VSGGAIGTATMMLFGLCLRRTSIAAAIVDPVASPSSTMIASTRHLLD
jgi:hypothetical protein